MKKNTGSFFAAVFLLLLLCGCGPELIALNETHNGQIIDCSKGDIVEIRLPGNPTTGYVWQQSRRPVNDVVVLKHVGYALLCAVFGIGVVGLAGSARTVCVATCTAGSTLL